MKTQSVRVHLFEEISTFDINVYDHCPEFSLKRVDSVTYELSYRRLLDGTMARYPVVRLKPANCKTRLGFRWYVRSGVMRCIPWLMSDSEKVNQYKIDYAYNVSVCGEQIHVMLISTRDVRFPVDHV